MSEMNEKTAREIVELHLKREPFKAPSDRLCVLVNEEFQLSETEPINLWITRLAYKAEGYLLRVEQENAELSKLREQVSEDEVLLREAMDTLNSAQMVLGESRILRRLKERLK